MRLDLIYAPKKLFLEYGGLEFGKITLNDAIDRAGTDNNSLIAIQCPKSGFWTKALNNRAMHAQLIKKAQDADARDAWYALRAYWVPSTGSLMLYQMETPSGHMIDPPEEVISQLARNLHIHNEIMSIDIIG